MSSNVETEMQRKQTKAYIAADPTTVILNRAETVPNGAGGFTHGAPSARSPQVCKFIAPSDTATERQMLDGQMVQVDWVLLFEYDADVKRGDWFFQDGIKYEVVTVRHTGRYEVKAEVTNRG